MTATVTIDPKQIDAQLAEIGAEIAKRSRIIEDGTDLWHRVAGDHRLYKHTRMERWAMLDSEAEQTARAMHAAGTVDLAYSSAVATVIARVDAALVESRELREQHREVEAPYIDAPWTRYFLVTSSDGHIHSSTSCSTCHITTRFAWLTDMSGETVADTVAKHGALLCTVCFPDAPVEWTNGRELEAAAKAAAQCPGSGTYNYPADTARKGYVRGNYGVCEHCGQRASLTSTGRMRAHKPAAAE